MLPTRFASVRQRKRTAVRIASFRDDTNLVALRYDKTVAAEPPIPIPPRNPRRPSTSTSRPSTSRTSSSSSTTHYTFTHAYGPVVVAPPLPLVAPPAEEHPALRSPLPPSRAVAVDSGKRDSGHAPAASSPTIPEEDCEDDDDLYRKVDELAVSAVQHVEDLAKSVTRTAEDEASLYSVDCRTSSDTADRDDRDLHLETEAETEGDDSNATARPPRHPAAYSPTASPIGTPTPTPTPTTHQAFPSHQQQQPSPSPRRLARRFSFRSLSLMRTKSPSLASEPGTSTGPASPAPMQPLMRGSSPPPATSASSRVGPATIASTSSTRFWTRSKSDTSSASSTISDAPDFSPLAIAIPTDSLLDDDFLTALSFSKRGSIMFGGHRASGLDGAMDDTTASSTVANDNDAAAKAAPNTTTSTNTPAPTPTTTIDTAPTPPSQQQLTPSATTDATGESNDSARDPLPTPDIRVLAVDVEKESQKVRSLYAVDDGLNWEEGGHSYERLEPTPEAAVEDEVDEHEDVPSIAHLNPAWGTPRSGSSLSQRADNAKKDTELAGGLEDWEDVDGAHVDRYGFISPPRPRSRIGTPTDMKSAQLSPRRRNVLQKRDQFSPSSPLARRMPSKKMSARSLNTQNSEMSTTSVRSSRSVMRQAGNLFPHNRDRRWMDEAGDMLAVSPSLQDIAEEMQAEKISDALKRKEWERSEKWRKMAKAPKKDNQGQGMEFEFDTKNPKLIERTWKGIPDRWRAAAWWSFLAASAKNQKDAPTVEEIIADFHRLQKRGSPDDVQIDLDVPRTINRHIMFRRRYRGGQRLMFRVLHALSIYFPVTGYVQGMASLAATLLCYFDEEKCFVMLVRLWQLRGLDRLYRPGFEGLMNALREFETSWLNKDVAAKLTEECVDSTAYGTRWYLTLFNLSIPFPAQLRVWDVFLLLGDGIPDNASTPDSSKPGESTASPPPTGLDILHATSAALIEALREVLLDSDFENVMKALTSWITIKDEDLLMKVTKAEWKTHQGRKKT